MTAYRAEARREHNGRETRWKGRWHEDPTRALRQAQRWQGREAVTKVSICASDGSKISLLELEQRQGSEVVQ